VTSAEGMKKFPIAWCRSGVLLELGGQQVLAVDSNVKLLELSATASTSPISHLYVSHHMFFVVPPIMLSSVALSLFPCALLVHVLLECLILMQYPCVQQYSLRSQICRRLARNFPWRLLLLLFTNIVFVSFYFVA
jgi:hypothetical protein